MEIVYSDRYVPVAVTFAGYARRLADTVRIHANTVRIGKEFADKTRSRSRPT
jgi:hypothetical protein